MKNPPTIDRAAFFREYGQWEAVPRLPFESDAMHRWRACRVLAHAEGWATDNDVRFAWDPVKPTPSSLFESTRYTCTLYRDGVIVLVRGDVNLGGPPWTSKQARAIEAGMAYTCMTEGLTNQRTEVLKES